MRTIILILTLISLTITGFSQTFTELNSGVTPSILYDVSFIGNKGLVVGTSSTILTTIDAGNTWTSVNTGFSTEFRGALMVNTSTYFVVGLNGVILKSTDSGSTWTSLNSGTTGNLTRIVLNGNTLFAVGNNAMVKSTDMGATWSSISYGGYILYDIFFASPMIGFTVGGDGEYILRTLDGGNTWTVVNSASTNTRFLGVHFTDLNTGYVVGGNNSNQSKILKTTDGGNTWTTTTNGNNYLTAVVFTSANVGYIIGGDIPNNTSTILKTTDAGASWSVLPTSSFRQVGACISSDNLGYTCGVDGSIMKVGNLGVEEAEYDPGMTIYPNPAKGILNVEFQSEQSGNVILKDANGKTISAQTVVNSKEIQFNLSDFPAGIYFVEFALNDHRFMKRVVVE